jgi:acyl-CoA hydrolase
LDKSDFERGSTRIYTDKSGFDFFDCCSIRAIRVDPPLSAFKRSFWNLTFARATLTLAGTEGRTQVSRSPKFLDTVEACVAAILEHVGSELRLGAPLGLGKPNVLLNALYVHAEQHPDFRLTLFTALSLERPRAKSDLERRFLEPFLQRHFGPDYPDLAYVKALHVGTLPKNVCVHEFYLQSGAMLGVSEVQRNYISMNYTHVARDMHGAGINAFTQLVAVREEAGQRRYSLACNPDITADLLDQMQASGTPRPLVVGVVHPDLPFIGNDAEVDAGFFDVILDDPKCRHTLFALPREPVDVAEYALGLHASTLVRDGGTLQIGIGTLSDALVYALVLRHDSNADYRRALACLGHDTAVARNDDCAAFVHGLYGASEMVMDGFMHLARAGILSRRVYDDMDVERALANGAGIDVANRSDGRYLRGAFYLGSKDFYAWLRGLSGADFDGLSMTRVSDINQLYGGRESLDALQRRHARFFNICMMATALGAAVSDALDSGQVVSGVGGQYNFVAMAHAIPDGRSILMLRSTRSHGGKVSSNILWNYGHTTIPRHLRDVYVTEYGIADLRGRSDEECIQAMLSIADARFQDNLMAQAKGAGKLRKDFVIPPAWRGNTPQGLRERLQPLRTAGLFPVFPFGSDFTAEELKLLPALKKLQQVSGSKAKLAAFLLGSLIQAEPAGAATALARLELANVRGLREWALKKLVLRAVRESGTK